MNERIQGLAKQAGIFYYRKGKLQVDMEKFTEVLVKEAGALLMSPEFIGRSDLDWAMVLNEHFGVK